MPFLGALSGAVLIYCLFVMCLNLLFANRIKIRQRLDEAENINRSLDHSDQARDFSLGETVILPFVKMLIGAFTIFVPRNEAYLKRTDEQLKQAGIRMSARNYRAAVLLFTVLLIIAFAAFGYFVRRSLLYALIMGILGLYAGFVLARFHLKSRVTSRKRAIYHQMPEMLDLLSVSVSAGLGFDQALTYVVQKCQGALFDEVNIAQMEISLGRPRRDALVDLADRCGNLEMKTFVSAVLQADEMGASMQNVLQVQADTIRLTHKQAVEEEAQKLSIKMLFPLVFFIFPVMLIVLMGPAFMSIRASLFGGN